MAHYKEEKPKRPKKNQLSPILFVVLVLVLIFAAAFFLKAQVPLLGSWFNSLSGISPETVSVPPVNVERGDVKILETVQKKMRCGDWPVANVETNPNRGNPFQKKTETVTSTATSTAVLGAAASCAVMAE